MNSRSWDAFDSTAPWRWRSTCKNCWLILEKDITWPSKNTVTIMQIRILISNYLDILMAMAVIKLKAGQKFEGSGAWGLRVQRNLNLIFIYQGVPRPFFASGVSHREEGWRLFEILPQIKWFQTRIKSASLYFTSGMPSVLRVTSSPLPRSVKCSESAWPSGSCTSGTRWGRLYPY